MTTSTKQDATWTTESKNILPQANNSTAADASVAWPHKGTSLAGVNHRNLKGLSAIKDYEHFRKLLRKENIHDANVLKKIMKRSQWSATIKDHPL